MPCPCREIVVEVRGGVAYVTKCPPDCYVTIKDYDDRPDMDAENQEDQSCV